MTEDKRTYMQPEKPDQPKPPTHEEQIIPSLDEISQEERKRIGIYYDEQGRAFSPPKNRSR